MTVDPFWFGVFSTIFVEMALLVIAGIYKTFKEQKESNNEREQGSYNKH